MAKEGYKLSGIVRDFKKFVSEKIQHMLLTEVDSRSKWLLEEMRKAAFKNSKKVKYQLWRNDNHPILLYKPATISQKLNYIHNNPVEEGIVEYASEYLYSSAKDYSGGKGLVKVERIR